MSIHPHNQRNVPVMTTLPTFPKSRWATHSLCKCMKFQIDSQAPARTRQAGGSRARGYAIGAPKKNAYTNASRRAKPLCTPILTRSLTRHPYTYSPPVVS